jgi:hypothetical protein
MKARKIMKRPILFLITVLVIASLACSINVNVPSPKVGATQTYDINEAPPASAPAELHIGMGGGKLNIQPGGKNFIQGTVEYNVSQWKPTITRTNTSVSVQQQLRNGIPLPSTDLVNNWDLKLGETPMNLIIEAGAYQGTINLSGVPLTGLKVTDGASQANVEFNTPNPQIMETFTYETGASNIKLTGLANANFNTMNFSCGAGNYVLNFSGKLTHDAQANINGGLGNLTIIIPKGMNANVVLGASLNNIQTQGVWTVEGQKYSVSGEGPTLTIDLNVGVGNLTLVNE